MKAVSPTVDCEKLTTKDTKVINPRSVRKSGERLPEAPGETRDPKWIRSRSRFLDSDAASAPKAGALIAASSLGMTLTDKRLGMTLAGKRYWPGPTPPVWQSEQLTCVRSPMSTGCLNGMPWLLP